MFDSDEDFQAFAESVCDELAEMLAEHGVDLNEKKFSLIIMDADNPESCIHFGSAAREDNVKALRQLIFAIEDDDRETATKH